MLFNSLEFPIFFAIVLVGAALLRRWPTAEKWFLVAASAYFYGQWSWSYLILIYVTIVTDYLIGLRMPVTQQPKRYLLVSLIVNLGILGFFKYANFLTQSADSVLTLFGGEWPFSAVDVLLPVGISFYTFQSLSYTIDLYRDGMAPRRRFVDYALFVSFFPQLVAGPIVRASEFFEQLDVKRLIDFKACQVGLLLICIGLVKKVVFADNLALIADPVFTDPESVTGLHALFGLYAFAFQIYFDFSAYSDIAIGCARILGFKFPQNFDHPYISLSIQEFWRRWHMTLSRWLRDYLYIPLGGSRGSQWLTARNLFLTMFLGGLWHGASWNFAVWGVLHGVYLGAERYGLMRFAWWRDPKGHINKVIRWVLCFHLVCFAWIFFRADSFSISGQMISQIGSLDGNMGALTKRELLLVLSMPVLHFLGARLNFAYRGHAYGTLRYAFTIVACILALIWFAPEQAAPFIYFQF